MGSSFGTFGGHLQCSSLLSDITGKRAYCYWLTAEVSTTNSLPPRLRRHALTLIFFMCFCIFYECHRGAFCVTSINHSSSRSRRWIMVIKLRPGALECFFGQAHRKLQQVGPIAMHAHTAARRAIDSLLHVFTLLHGSPYSCNLLHPKVYVNPIGCRIDALPSDEYFNSLTGDATKSVLGNSSSIDTSLCAVGSSLSTLLVNVGPFNSKYKWTTNTFPQMATTGATITCTGANSAKTFSCTIYSIDTGVLICDSGSHPSLPGGTWSESCRQD